MTNYFLACQYQERKFTTWFQVLYLHADDLLNAWFDFYLSQQWFFSQIPNTNYILLNFLFAFNFLKP